MLEVSQKEVSQDEPLPTSPVSRDPDNLMWFSKKATGMGKNPETMTCGKKLEELRTGKLFLVSNKLSCKRQKRFISSNSVGQCKEQQTCMSEHQTEVKH